MPFLVRNWCGCTTLRSEDGPSRRVPKISWPPTKSLRSLPIAGGCTAHEGVRLLRCNSILALAVRFRSHLPPIRCWNCLALPASQSVPGRNRRRALCCAKCLKIYERKRRPDLIGFEFALRLIQSHQQPPLDEVRRPSSFVSRLRTLTPFGVQH